MGLITTPPTYYTTQKARYLGEKYKNNLDRLVERIVSNQKTAKLQFANNIASVGGIGFFTHSATNSVDERFLEIIMGVPETFDSTLDHDAKVQRVFSLYGAELLSILASDSDIYEEKQVKGYGLSLSWRNGWIPPLSWNDLLCIFPKGVRSFLRGDLVGFLSGGDLHLTTAKWWFPRPQELKPIREGGREAFDSGRSSKWRTIAESSPRAVLSDPRSRNRKGLLIIVSER